MKLILRRQWLYLVLTLVFALTLFVISEVNEKGWMVRWFAERRSGFLNDFFNLVTWFGNGLLIASVIVVAGLVRVGNALALGGASILTSLVVQFLKRVVFAAEVRPSVYFEQIGQPLAPIDGVEFHSSFSFPSGHAAGAFALFLGLALLRPGVLSGALCFAAAALTAISRVYLGQHFTSDVIAGAVIGTCITAMVFAIVLPAKWYERKWARYSVIKGSTGP